LKDAAENVGKALISRAALKEEELIPN